MRGGFELNNPNFLEWLKNSLVTSGHYIYSTLNSRAFLALLTMVIAYLTALALKRSMAFQVYGELEEKLQKWSSIGEVPQSLQEHAQVIFGATLKSPTEERIVNYFDFKICNTGPGSAKDIRWKLTGEPRKVAIGEEGKSIGGKRSIIKEDTLKFLLPQGCRVVIGYLDPTLIYSITLTKPTRIREKRLYEWETTS